jgi:hypothetical protein
VTWDDGRDGGLDIYAQSVDGFGGLRWNPNGVLVNHSSLSLYAEVIPDAGGGAIVSWVDRRNGNANWDIYAQKIDGGGALMWADNGVPACAKSGNQDSPSLASDGHGGAFVTWNEPVSVSNPTPDVFVQHIDAGGTAGGGIGGYPVCLAASGQFFPKVVADGFGGAFMTWMDARTGGIQDIYAQRIAANGAAAWSSDGVPVSTAVRPQRYPEIVNAFGGGVIVAWVDLRNDPANNRNDVYLQWVAPTGSLGGTVGVDPRTPRVARLEPVQPNPTSSIATIAFSLPTASAVSLRIFDPQGRRVADLTSGLLPAGAHTRRWMPGSLPNGLYVCRLEADGILESRKIVVSR